MNETIVYLCGGVLVASGVVVFLVAQKRKGFPGRAMPLLIGWFVVLGLGAVTFALIGGSEDPTPSAQEFALNGEAESTASEMEGEEREEENEETGGEEFEIEEQISGGAESLEGEIGSEATAAGGEASRGTVVFSENCSICHGGTGHGGNGGPDLRTMPLAQTEAGSIEQVTNGGGGMPAFKGQLKKKR